MNEKCKNKENCELTPPRKNECKNQDAIEIMPLVDIVENEHAMVMYFEIPGAAPEDVSVQIANHILSVEAKSSLTRKGRTIVFRRCFQLTNGTDINSVHAKTQDGVLTLTLPKSEDAKVHKIEVEG